MNILKRWSCILGCWLVGALLLSNCATVPGYDQNLALAEIRPATIQEIRQFGANTNSNPYLEPSTLLRGKIYEFHILKLKLNVKEKIRISIICDVFSDPGKNASKAYTAEEFSSLWEFASVYSDDTNPAGNARSTNIQRSCLPSYEFTETPGIHEYFIPIAGRYPMTKPVNIYIQVTNAGGESYEFREVLQ